MAYTESIFLVLTVGSLFLAWEVQRTGRRDLLYPLAAGLVAALAALTRYQGLFVALSVAWLLAVAPRNFPLLMRIRNAVLAIAPAVLAFGGYVAYIGLRTGHLLAVFKAHNSWGTGYWNDFPYLLVLPPENPGWPMGIMETVGLVLWIVLSIVAGVMFYKMWRARQTEESKQLAVWPGAWAFAIYAAASIGLVLYMMTANQSWGRYMLAVFPLFWAWAWWVKSDARFQRLIMTLFGMQIVYFVAMIAMQVTP
jgi:hypothetical protein